MYFSTFSLMRRMATSSDWTFAAPRFSTLAPPDVVTPSYLTSLAQSIRGRVSPFEQATVPASFAPLPPQAASETPTTEAALRTDARRDHEAREVFIGVRIIRYARAVRVLEPGSVFANDYLVETPLAQGGMG